MTSAPTSVPVCYRHPGRETYLSCTRCERPICPECMIPASVGHQCPECVRQGQAGQRKAVTAFGGDARVGSQGYVTKALIGINVAIFLIGALLSLKTIAGGGWGGLLGQAGDLSEWGALRPGSSVPFIYTDQNGPHLISSLSGVATGEWYRIFTSMFLHYGLLHVAMNMWALWAIGRVIEQALGPVRFLALYLLAGMGGSVAAYFVTSPWTSTAGASGAIFGLFAALFILLKRVGRDTSSLLPVIIINVVVTFVVPGISIAGHIGGLITGAIVGFGLAYAPKEGRNVRQALVIGGTFVVLSLLVVARTVMINSAVVG
ncbi:membrane associated rhomboid family serine protease [Allocatelliglobosispora scoriae]|uniref:Membrane associated rhomboid family serine protease n=1 Tax=Allocatelliglobosispora scoriae TaxID=643052 RepID=A0A841BUL3_9ACTN|nr:rhomboid family intramembrane serine protease [Allocatelliglobosispora scoriae]MBB5871138.1 membrane associated rhomboid family serine protease [Allocatelliglobosispora scoriae]